MKSEARSAVPGKDRRDTIMAGSIIGKQFCITTWGESHGKALGVVIDGCPAGIFLSEEDVQIFMDRRKPGQSRYTTARKETDKVEILSGIFEGKTTGTPISMIVYNQDQRSRDYSDIAEIFRPGHADFGYWEKYGIRDYRGGGRSSGRETIGRVAAGAVAVRVLGQLGIRFLTYTSQIGPVRISRVDEKEINKNPLYMPDAEAAAAASAYLEECMARNDSAGGVIECVIEGMPAGIGDPVFDKLDAALARAVFSVGAVKGFEIGDGFAAAESCGSKNNDPFIQKEGHIGKASNHAGGILGGISDGSPIVFRAAVKPTPSISKTQRTVNLSGEEREINIRGRHDPVIVPRAVVVVESMAAVTILDQILCNLGAKWEDLSDRYGQSTARNLRTEE